MINYIIFDYMKDKKLKYSIFIKDLADEQVFCLNENEVVSSASIIKLFIMAKAFELVNTGVLDLNQRVNIDKSEKVPYSIINELDDKNTYTIKDLIVLMIIQSDNTAANKLIEILGIQSINEFIKDLGFADTVLHRKMMDFKARASGMDNYTSALDVARLLELMYKGELVCKGCSDMMLEILKLQFDSSMMRIHLEDELVVAHKTGALSNIKHDAGIVYAGLKNYIFVMLTWDAESDSYARNIIGGVSRITYDYLISGGRE